MWYIWLVVNEHLFKLLSTDILLEIMQVKSFNSVWIWSDINPPPPISQYRRLQVMVTMSRQAPVQEERGNMTCGDEDCRWGCALKSGFVWVCIKILKSPGILSKILFSQWHKPLGKLFSKQESKSWPSAHRSVRPVDRPVCGESW